MKPVDYSERAVTQRLRQVSQLRRLCLSLMKAKPQKDPAPPSDASNVSPEATRRRE